MNLIEFLSQNPYVAAISTMVGVISGILGLWWGLKRRKKEITITYEDYEILSQELQSIDGLEIYYNQHENNEKLDILNITTFEIRCTGNMLVTREDIPSKGNIKVVWYKHDTIMQYWEECGNDESVLKEEPILSGKILEVKVIENSNDQSNPSFSINEGYNDEAGDYISCDLSINFEYLDSKDYFIIQVMHTFKKQEIRIYGKIKGGQIINKNMQRKKAKDNIAVVGRTIEKAIINSLR